MKNQICPDLLHINTCTKSLRRVQGGNIILSQLLTKFMYSRVKVVFLNHIKCSARVGNLLYSFKGHLFGLPGPVCSARIISL